MTSRKEGRNVSGERGRGERSAYYYSKQSRSTSKSVVVVVVVVVVDALFLSKLTNDKMRAV